MLVSIYLVKLTWYIFTFSIGEWFVIKKGQPNYYTEVQLEFLIKISFNMQRLLDSGNLIVNSFFSACSFTFTICMFHSNPFVLFCPLRITGETNAENKTCFITRKQTEFNLWD